MRTNRLTGWRVAITLAAATGTSLVAGCLAFAAM
jgi:hypothetical protein